MILHYDFLANCLKKVIIDKTKFYTMTNEEIFQLKDFSFKEKNNCISVVASSVRHYLFFRLTLNRKFNLKEDANIEQFNDDMKELLEMECDNIEPYLLSIDDINSMSNIKLEGNDIFTIDYLLEQ